MTTPKARAAAEHPAPGANEHPATGANEHPALGPDEPTADDPQPPDTVAAAAHPRTSAPARQGLRGWFAELGKFGSVGAAAYVVDTTLFNLLLFGPGELLGGQPVTAKVVSASIATLLAWLGNRYWTFSRSRRTSRGRELALFAAVNLGAMGIAVSSLAVSHYVLGFTSPVADNIAANVVGVGLGTIFRYVCYRYVVFTG